MTAPTPRFACDAMLGALARWLRAAGYDTTWQAGVDDWELILHARDEQRILLSSDTGVFQIGIVRDGDIPALFIPHGLSTTEQLGFVLQRLELDLREPRCMACGGELVERLAEQVRDRIPPRTREWCDRFYECRDCGKLFWEGTHWEHIRNVLERAASDREAQRKGGGR